MRGLPALSDLAKPGIPGLRRYGRKNYVAGTLQLNSQFFAGQPDLAKQLLTIPILEVRLEDCVDDRDPGET